MDDQNNPSDLFPGDAQLTPSDDAENANGSQLSLEELNKFLGRDYKTKDEALKGLKETTTYVSKAGNTFKENKILKKQLEEVGGNTMNELKQIKDQLFYSENPQYKDYKNVIAKMGENPSEVVNTEEFKKIFTDLTEYEKTKSAKSVLVTNPRIGQARTKLDEAKELSLKGQHAAAKDAAVNAVLEAYDLSQ